MRSPNLDLPMEAYAPREAAAMRVQDMPEDEAKRRYRELVEAHERRGEQGRLAL